MTSVQQSISILMQTTPMAVPSAGVMDFLTLVSVATSTGKRFLHLAIDNVSPSLIGKYNN